MGRYFRSMVHRLLTPEDIAAMVQVEPAEVLTWIQRDELDAIEFTTGVLRLDPAALRKFLLVRRRQFLPGGWRHRDGVKA